MMRRGEDKFLACTLAILLAAFVAMAGIAAWKDVNQPTPGPPGPPGRCADDDAVRHFVKKVLAEEFFDYYECQKDNFELNCKPKQWAHVQTVEVPTDKDKSREQ